MRIKQGFELRDVCGEQVVMACGKENIDFSRIISLNESAAHLWKAVQDKDFDTEVLAQLLTEEYDIDHATAAADARQLLSQWTAAGLLE